MSKNKLSSYPIYHWKHVLSLNSWFKILKDFDEFFNFSEDEAFKFYSEFLDWKKKSLENFFKYNRNFNELLNNKFDRKQYAPHWWWSIFEYALLAKLRWEKDINITIHEPRDNILLYDWEDKLNWVPRGEFWMTWIENVIKRAQTYEKLFWIKINFILESENLWTSEKAQKAKKRHSKYLKYFERKILSTHAISKDPTDLWASDENNLCFIDKDLDDFKNILHWHKGDMTSVIVSYVQSQIDHVNREWKKWDVLWHCDLIRCAIHRLLLESDEDLSQIELIAKINDYFNNDQVEDMYLKLFKIIEEKEMLLEINLSWEMKWHWYYWSGPVLEYMEKAQKNAFWRWGDLGIVIWSDTHGLEGEHKVDEIWEEVKDDFKILKLL